MHSLGRPTPLGLSIPHRNYGDVTCRGALAWCDGQVVHYRGIEERVSPPSSRRSVIRADVGATPAQGAVIPKPRPTAWVWERIRRCGLKGRDTLDVESSTTSSRSEMRQRCVVRGPLIAPRWGALSGKGSAYPG